VEVGDLIQVVVTDQTRSDLRYTSDASVTFINIRYLSHHRIETRYTDTDMVKSVLITGANRGQVKFTITLLYSNTDADQQSRIGID
jgi:alanine dehydrogenase